MAVQRCSPMTWCDSAVAELLQWVITSVLVDLWAQQHHACTPHVLANLLDLSAKTRWWCMRGPKWEASPSPFGVDGRGRDVLGLYTLEPGQVIRSAVQGNCNNQRRFVGVCYDTIAEKRFVGRKMLLVSWTHAPVNVVSVWGRAIRETGTRAHPSATRLGSVEGKEVGREEGSLAG